MRFLSLFAVLALTYASSLRGVSDEEPTTSTEAPSEPETVDTVSSVSSWESGFLTHDGERIAYRTWEPRSEPTGVVYIVHGMAEHSGRYDGFARDLVEALGVRVIALDQRGHGLTSTKHGTEQDKLGQYRKGANAAHANAITLMGHDVDELILATHDNLPIILFGHSMGSVVARTAMQVLDQNVHPLVKGLVLSGVPTTPHWAEKYALQGVASVIQTTGFGHALVQRGFTQFKFDYPVRQKVQAKELPENCWISSDIEECKIFNEDPYTNHLVAPEILLSIVNTLIDLGKATYFGPNSVDVMLITGRDDPVASFGDAARAAAERMSKAGHKVTEVYIGGARHEILRETASIRQEGVGQVIAWIRTKLGLKNGVI